MKKLVHTKINKHLFPNKKLGYVDFCLHFNNSTTDNTHDAGIEANNTHNASTKMESQNLKK